MLSLSLAYLVVTVVGLIVVALANDHTDGPAERHP